MKRTFTLLLALLAVTQLAEAKIQRQGVKTSADCIAGGSTAAACLISEAQIYDVSHTQSLTTTLQFLDATSSIQTQLNAKLSTALANGNFFMGVAGVATAQTGTQATAGLVNFVGDSGAGGVKGLVPAPAAGDAAANKFLHADGSWQVPAGGGASPLTTKGDIYVYSTLDDRLPVGANGEVLSADSSTATGLKWIAAGGTGTVTSVDLAVPGEFSVSGNPITTTGTITIAKVNQTANRVYAGPAAGGAAAPTFRALVVADIPAGLPYAPSALTTNNIFVGVAGVATDVAMSGDATIVASGALTIANSAVTNAKMANMAATTIKGNSTGGAAAPTDLTGTAVTALLDDFVGDSGAGGTKGLVPAPAAGDAAAGKFLKADGSWDIVTAGTPAASAIGASNIDWSLSGVYTKTLGANTTFTFSNQTSGQTIVVRLTNTASNYTVTWPGTVKWAGGVAPTMTIGAFSDVYTFVHDGTDIYGSFVQNF